MKVQTLVTVLLLPVLMLTATQLSAQKVTGSGDIKKETRSVKGSLQDINISGKYTLYISQGSTPSVEVEADDNLLPYIETEAEGNELDIRIRKGYNASPTKAIIIRVTTSSLKEINSSGNSTIISNGKLKGDRLEVALSGNSIVDMELQYDKLELAVSGDGKVKLKGSADKTEIAISGDGNIAASNMATDDMEVAISGKGEAHVNVSKKLEVSISGKGTVKYRGNPASVEQYVSGKGIIEKE